MDRILGPDCNRCQPAIKCKGMVMPQARTHWKESCFKWRKPQDTFMLAELVLGYPQSLHDALSRLSFDVRLDFYLR